MPWLIGLIVGGVTTTTWAVLAVEPIASKSYVGWGAAFITFVLSIIFIVVVLWSIT